MIAPGVQVCCSVLVPNTKPSKLHAASPYTNAVTVHNNVLVL